MTKKTDLQIAYEVLRAKSEVHTKLMRYYEGDQPTVYLTERLRDIFRGVDAVLTENWCSVVVNACLERLNLKSILISKEVSFQDTLDTILEDNQFSLEAEDLHEMALVTGEAFIIAWRESELEPVEFYLNDSAWTHCFYSPDQPRQISYAAKLYVDESGYPHLILYYPDRIEYYLSSRKWSDVTSSKAFLPDPEHYQGDTWPGNPFSRVPVFHFKTARQPRSELTNVIPTQNGINKLLADMMVAAEYGAFRQRWVISSAEVQGQLKSAPGELWDLPAGEGEGQDTQVGEFETTDLQNYLTAINQLANSIGIISRTPKHYFFNQGGDPSGEALIAMEAPLNKKVQDKIDRFTPVWKDLVVFLFELSGQTVDRSLIQIEYDKPETVQPKTEAEITKIRLDSQIPMEIALRWEGIPQSEIEEIMKLVNKSKADAAKSLSQALLAQEKSRNNEEQPGGLDNSEEEESE